MTNKKKIFIICVILILFFTTIFLKEYKTPWYLKREGIHYCNNCFSIHFIENNYKKKNLKDTIRGASFKEVRVAIIDTGVDLTNSNIKESIYKNKKEVYKNNIDDDNNGYIDDYYGYDFINDCNDVSKYKFSCYENEHGTLCTEAFIMSIKSIEKTAVEHVKVLPLKVSDNSNQNDKNQSQALIEAIEYAEDQGCLICNISLSTENYDDNLYQCMKKSKMLFIVASGNNNYNLNQHHLYPACFELENMITVGSYGCKGIVSSFSNYGDKHVDIFAPGEKIKTNGVGNEQKCIDGTSFATAIVSGYAAYLYMINININNFKIKEIITSFFKNN